MTVRHPDPWPNRHTEECTSCGARRRELHDDDCRGHLGTGIRNLDGARKELRRRWRQEPIPEPVARPGHRFYVTVRAGRRSGPLLGPYVSHLTALANVGRARALATAVDDMAWHYRYGTASAAATVPTRFGR